MSSNADETICCWLIQTQMANAATLHVLSLSPWTWTWTGPRQQRQHVLFNSTRTGMVSTLPLVRWNVLSVIAVCVSQLYLQPYWTDCVNKADCKPNMQGNVNLVGPVNITVCVTFRTDAKACCQELVSSALLLWLQPYCWYWHQSVLYLDVTSQ